MCHWPQHSGRISACVFVTTRRVLNTVREFDVQLFGAVEQGVSRNIGRGRVLGLDGRLLELERLPVDSIEERKSFDRRARELPDDERVPHLGGPAVLPELPERCRGALPERLDLVAR